jgi:hypothetical protein
MVITGEMYYDAVEYREVMTFNYADRWIVEVGSWKFLAWQEALWRSLLYPERLSLVSRCSP